MKRYVTVYALNDRKDMLSAAKALESVKPLLPDQVSLGVFNTSNVDTKSLGVPGQIFGDLIQVLDFTGPDSGAYTYEDFLKSEARAELLRRTKGLFTSETTIYYYWE